MSQKSTRRILNDIKQYNNSDLKDNGIYVIFNEDNIYNCKAMIVGPKDTPYAYGYYFFDINFPNTYPIKNPRVDFCTLDERVRFNPNLYDNGKVCLSILGTWSGPGWTTCLNLNTVLLSIQSLLNENPIVNEPGFEKETGTKAKNYSSIINYFNIKTATIKMLENPPHGFDVFKDIMIKHFNKNIDYYRKYISENKDKHNSNIFSTIYSMNTIMDIFRLRNRIDTLYFQYNNTNNETSDNNETSGNNEMSNNNETTNTKKKNVRKAPNDLAKIYDIGYTMVSENDGKIWKVVEVVVIKLEVIVNRML